MHPFNRGYFEGDAYVGLYRDFPVHFNTVEIIKKRKPESVLDIGGARGYVVKHLNDIGIPSTVMDVSEHCFHTRATDNFVLHSATDVPYPFKDKEFDLAISISVLEHIPEEHIPATLREIARVSKRGLHGISFESHPGDIDKTHINMKPIKWWQKAFEENCPGYEYEILDKEETEKGTIELPVPKDNLVKLNVGSFINMFHYNWVNTDVLNLTDFAKQNGYIFRQLDASKGLPYSKNSVDLIIASHFLEHLDRIEGKQFLANCLRILKPNGILRLAVPDAELITKKYIDNSISDFADVNIGVEKSTDDAHSLFELLLAGHKTIYDLSSLSFLLKDVGFVNIDKKEFNKSYSKEIETQTIDSYPTLSLYVEAQKSDIEEEDKANDKLRIGIISTPFFTVPPAKYGGLEQVVYDLACGLDKLGHHTVIFGPEGSKATSNGELIVTGPSISTIDIDWFQAEKNAYEIYKQYIESGNYDFIVDNTWFAFIYLSKINNPNMKMVHVNHGGYSWSSAPPIAKPNLVAISDFMKQYTINYFAQKGQNVGCERVYNGIDLQKYTFDPNIKKTNRLLYVGRLSTFKQPIMAVDLARKTGYKLDIIGSASFVDSDQYVARLDEMCKDDPNITIYKDVNHEFKIEKMQNAKAVIIPSRMNEPLNLVSLESQACGTAVITTRDGGLPETVVQGVTGFVCDNMSDMIAAVEDIDKIKPEDCRKHIEDNFSRQVMAENYLKLYEKIQNNQEW